MPHFFSFAAATADTAVCAMQFTVGGDAEHYTVGANAAVLLLLVHVLPFTILVGSMLEICFLLCTCSDSYYCPLRSVYYRSRRYCALQLLLVQVGISPFDAAIWGKQPFYSAVGVHIFSTASLGVLLPFLRRLVLSSPVVTEAILQQSALL